MVRREPGREGEARITRGSPGGEGVLQKLWPSWRRQVEMGGSGARCRIIARRDPWTRAGIQVARRGASMPHGDAGRVQGAVASERV